MFQKGIDSFLFQFKKRFPENKFTWKISERYERKDYNVFYNEEKIFAIKIDSFEGVDIEVWSSYLNFSFSFYRKRFVSYRRKLYGNKMISFRQKGAELSSVISKKMECKHKSS